MSENELVSSDEYELELESSDESELEESSEGPAPAGLSRVIRFFIERSAELVCENGPEFEKRVKAKSVGNPKFSFFWSSDPYHEFYQQKISEYKQKQKQQQQQTEFPKSSVDDDDEGIMSRELAGLELKDLPPTNYIVMFPPCDARGRHLPYVSHTRSVLEMGTLRRRPRRQPENGDG
ncbi:hypothetical protein EUTSA_v10014821mg [Eutrema salsugineum]|uniref:SURP motif domain-containing protein n=1 Tax=Eutrema salsugineum TaxID=72664 RepID=V4N678_EUTSA|nr:hypothetical protein EUTSA_v10014821mg [Eutrema salsugineum]